MGDFMKIKMIDAALSGDLEDLNFCLQLGAIDVNFVNETGITALIAAIQNGSAECVKTLLTHPNLDVNKPEKDGKTALFIACQKGFRDIVAALLKHPLIEVNTFDKFGTSALMVALRARLDDIFILLLKHPKINVNYQKKDGTTALMYAIQLNHSKIVRELLKHKDINMTLTNKSNQTAQDIANKKGNVEILSAFAEVQKRKESKLSKATSLRFKAKNRNMKKYTATLKRNSSISELSESENEENEFEDNNEKDLNTNSKEKTKALTEMIRLKSLNESSLEKEMKVVKKKNKTEEQKQERLTELFKDVNENKPEATGERTESVVIKGGKKNPVENEEVAKKSVNLSAQEIPKKNCLLFSTEEKQSSEFISQKAFHNINFTNVSNKELNEVFKEIGKTTSVVFLLNDNFFFDEKNNLKNIACLIWCFVKKVKFISVLAKDADENLFKTILRQGGNIFSNENWEKLKEFDIKYPDFYDTVEFVSKSVIRNTDDVKALLEE